jgi:hypothetical protein
MAKMTDDDLRQVVDGEVAEAAAWAGTNLAGDRERNLAYYYGLPMGNEVAGRSQVVSRDVFEVIESAIPSMLEPFFAGDHIGEFEPVEPGDEDYAEQATDYINHLIKKKNDGFVMFNTWIKDGLLSKAGVVRVWWDASAKIKKESYKGLTDAQLVKIVNDKRITITAHDAYPDPDDEQHRAEAQQHMASAPPEQQQQIAAMLQQPPQQLHDIDVTIDQGPRGARTDNVPPELFVISRGAKKIEEASVIGEFRQYTRSDLIEMGYKKAEVENLSEYDIPSGISELALRNQDTTWNGLDDSQADTSMQKLWLFYGFARVDFNGDGIAEWRRVLQGGNGFLENEEVDDHEYCMWSPILLPHRVIGMAYADAMIEVQDTKTSLMRQYLDSLYTANNPTSFAVDGQVNLDDMLSTRIGKVVRMKQPGMAGPMQSTLVANESLQGLELMDTVREGRIGVTRYTQGLDADALHKTASGAAQFLSQAQQRLKMTLRIFAECGVKALFQKMLKLTCTYQDKPATVRLRGEWIDYDPRQWSGDMDVNIAVGLGTGDKSQEVQFLQLMTPFFQEAAMVGVVTPENVYQLGKRLLKAGNLQGADAKLLTDPSKTPPKAPQKSPEQLLAETTLQQEQMRQQGKMAEIQAKQQADREALAANTQLKAMDLQIKDKEVRIKEIDLGLKNAELQHKIELDRHHATVEAETRGKIAADHAPVLHALGALHEKLDSHARMETHIVRGPDGKASHAVKIDPQQFTQEAE